MMTRMAQQLRGAAQDGSATRRLSLNDLLQLHGQDSGAVLLMLMGLLSIVPVAGAGSLMSLGIFALAWAWLCGRDNLRLPARLGKLSLNDTWSRRSLHSLAWSYERADRWLRPRWTALSHARARSGWALWMALMGVLIFLPLPLGNVLPGISLMLLSLGWLFRDGLALLSSAAVGAVGVAYALSVSHFVIAAWHQSGSMLGL